MRTCPSQPQSCTNFLLVRNVDKQLLLADQVSLAVDSKQRRRGLAGFTHLPSGSGLWIMPSEAIHTFGMAFPIDVIFLDKANKVRKLREALFPGKICYCLSAHSVLELAVGSIAHSHTEPGDHLAFEETPA
jgi:uncharacterized protein